MQSLGISAKSKDGLTFSDLTQHMDSNGGKGDKEEEQKIGNNTKSDGPITFSNIKQVMEPTGNGSEEK